MSNPKRITLSDKKISRLYADVTEVCMRTRIKIAQLYPNFNGDELDKILMEMMHEVGEEAINSIQRDKP